VILLDANIFMYAAGREHPYKTPSADLIDRIAEGKLDVAIDAEVLQEILHRYRAIDRWEDGKEVYELARALVPIVISITADVLDKAKELLDDHPHLTARDALHAAVYFESGAEVLCSYDGDFDTIAGLKRLEPQALLARDPPDLQDP
jgi:predicted nucleic acid-binding protein